MVRRLALQVCVPSQRPTLCAGTPGATDIKELFPKYLEVYAPDGGSVRRGLAYYLAGAVVMRRELPDRRVEFQVLGQHEDSYGVIFDFGPNYKRAECLCARQTSASRHQVGAHRAGASGSLLTCACAVTEGLVQAHHRLSGDGRLRQRDRPGVGSAYAGSERGDRVGLL